MKKICTNISLIYKSLISVIIFNFFAPSVKAASIMESTGCLAEGNCQMNDFIKIVLAGGKLVLGLSGSAALLFFVFGGVTFLISGGSQEKVTKGKQMIVGSAIGMFIVFASYTIIGFIISALGISGGANWFTAGKF